jgi:hypothetical protein
MGSAELDTSGGGYGLCNTALPKNRQLCDMFDYSVNRC